MIIMPVRNRRQNMLRFLEDCQRTKVTEKICILIDVDDAHNYLEIDFPANFEIEVVSPTFGVQQKLNYAFLKYYNEDYYAFIGDDLIPLTDAWDQKLKAELKYADVVYGDDGIQGKNLPTHPWVDGNLVRKIGWFCCPRIQHWYFDNVWKDIGECTGLGYVPQVKFDHQHPIKNPEKMDTTYSRQPKPEFDQAHYQFWNQYELPELIERLNYEEKYKKPTKC